MIRDHEIRYLVLEETKELSRVEWFSNRCLLNVMEYVLLKKRVTMNLRSLS
jgi:hypothetical protein